MRLSENQSVTFDIYKFINYTIYLYVCVSFEITKYIKIQSQFLRGVYLTGRDKVDAKYFLYKKVQYIYIMGEKWEVFMHKEEFEFERAKCW